MTKDFTVEIIRKLQAMYKADAVARRLFDWVAARQKDASETTLDRFSAKLGVNRGEAVALAKKLADADCGEFVVGRRGSKSRFVWAYSCISLGQAAAGESADLEAVMDAVSDDEDADEFESDRSGPTVTGTPPARITISEAKSLLASSLGVESSSIEIVIKA